MLVRTYLATSFEQLEVKYQIRVTDIDLTYALSL